MEFGWIIAGPIGGWLAGLVLKGDREFDRLDIVIGLLGALVGGVLFGVFAEGLVGQTIAAFLAAVLLTLGYERFSKRPLD